MVSGYPRDPNLVSVEDRPDYLWLPLGQGKPAMAAVDNLAIKYLHQLSRPETKTRRTQLYRSSVNTLIPDWPMPGVESSISIDEPIQAQRVTVGYTVLHDFIYDLSIRLVRNGREIVLFDRKPKGSYTAIVDRHVLDEFGGMDVSGEWTLVATDHGARNMGRFLDWHIEFELDAPISNGYDDTE